MPHRVERFKFSTDPAFATKMADVVGLYLHPPEKALVLCIDEKSLVERWFGLITSQAIRRGSFDSVAELERAINAYLANWNDDPKPFSWTKTPGQILWRIRRAKDRYAARD